MKKLFFIVFSFIYLISSAGVNINIHYCGGKIKDISFFPSEEENCCGKKMENKKCCSEKNIIYKVKEIQSGTSQIIISKISLTLPYVSAATSNSNFAKSDSGFSGFSFLKEPPDIVYNKSYLVNRVFLI